MNVKGLSQKEFDTLSASIRKAFGDKDGGMMAIAKAVAPAIYDAIEEKEIASLLLTQHVLPKGESAKYDKVREVKAYWIAKGGQSLPPRKRGCTSPMLMMKKLNSPSTEWLPLQRWIYPFCRTVIFTV